MKKHFLLPAVAALLLCNTLQAQKIGLLTANPQAPVHIASSGQVNTEGGLLVLGDTSEAHMELDFNILQSNFGAGPFDLQLQPYGGKVGINTFFPTAPFHVASSGQVNTLGGLVVLGSPDEGHMELDFDLIQSNFGATSYLPLRIQPAGGNLNVGNGLIHADRANKFVGINTVNANTELQVHGEMRLTTAGLLTTQKDKVAIYGELEESSTVGFGWIKNDLPIGGSQDGSSPGRNMVEAREIYTKSQGAHRWFINKLANTTTPDMILSAGGELGVGPDVTNARLHLTGNYNTTLINKGLIQLGPTNNTNLVMDANEIQVRSNGAASNLFLQFWGGNTYLCEPAASKVGIGTVSPISKLHITDGVDASLTTHGHIVNGTTTSTNLVMDDNEIMARNNGATSTLFLQNDGGNLLMCGSGSGRVGIGVPNEASMPSADYLLAVDGKIISEEVRVELSGDWPDYVFQDNYILKPLEKVQEEIKELGHLPGMPSAEQVENEGFELGDMQRRLLEKVEELTLYVLQLNQDNKELSRQVELLQAQIKGE